MLKNLTPQFLKTLDGWLLKNWPLVWRTRIHWVLFGSLVVHLLTVVCYGLYPLRMEDLEVYWSARPMLLTVGLITIVFAFLFWMYRTVRIPIKANHYTEYASTAVLYWLGCVIIASNLWMVDLKFDQKVTGLIQKSVLESDEDAIEDFLYYVSSRSDDSYRQERIDKERVNFEELILRYKLEPPKFQLTKDYLLKGGTESEIKFEYTLKEVLLKVGKKQALINEAYHARRLYAFREDYDLLYALIVVSFIALPMILLSVSNSNLKQLFLVCFLHFLLLIPGVLFLSVSEVFWGYLLLFLLVLFATLYIRQNKIKSIIYTFLSFIVPIIFIYSIVDRHQIYVDNLLHFYISSVLGFSLLIVTVSSLIYGLFQQQIIKPQIA